VCRKDADCGWDDLCRPQRCGSAEKQAVGVCGETAAPPGTCGCVEEMCTLRRSEPAGGASRSDACVDDDDCAVDVATATCHPHGDGLIGPIHREGPYCACRQVTGRCELMWQAPVPCRTWRDCSWVSLPRLRPVSAREVPRPLPRPVRPCRDSEVDAVCDGESGRKTCRIVGWSC
jgi:hypothetical protein